MHSQWGTIANPHAKVFDPPAPQVPPPGAWPQQQNKNSVQYIFFYLWEHAQSWYKKFEIDMVTEI